MTQDDIETATIERLGARGDGVAETASGRLHVPFAAPGDRATVRRDGQSGTIVDLLSPGSARVTPPCSHFGRCGGCALQHLDRAFIASWKRERVVEALARAGLADAPVAETIAILPGTRRRATFAAKRLASGVVLGFAERASHRLVDLAECPVLVPALVNLVPKLRDLLVRLLGKGEECDVALTATESGVEMTLVRGREPSLAEREALAAFADAEDLACIAWRARMTRAAEPIAARRTPLVRFAGYAVAVPSGGFLQPSVEGEAVLTSLVRDALGAMQGPVVDLFAGLGTFALPAVALGRVQAFDGDAESVAALDAAIRANGLTGRLSATRRDLFRDPLTAAELDSVSAAIVDPPRAGAEAQSRMLALSRVPRIAAVSCDPVSFARDAAILAAGGYRLVKATPVDQFAWSPHVELVAAFAQ